MTVKVVSPAEAERANFAVCCRVGSPQHFTDDEYGTCAHCGHPIFFRPHLPKAPTKICVQCCIDTLEDGQA